MARSATKAWDGGPVAPDSQGHGRSGGRDNAVAGAGSAGGGAGVSRERAALARTLARRSHDAVDRLVELAPVALLEEALEAPTGIGGVARLVSGLADVDVSFTAVDPEAGAVARAAQHKTALLERTPTFSTAEAAAALGVRPNSVTKRRLAGKLLALPVAGGDYRYPAFQFTGAPGTEAGSDNGVLPGFVDVLQAIPVSNPWVRTQVLTTPVDALDGRTLLDLVRTGRPEDLAEAVEAAARYGEHGA